MRIDIIQQKDLMEVIMALNIMQKLSYGVYAVTTWRDGEPKGCIANCAIQVTAAPTETFAVSIHHDNYTNECIKKSGKFAISVLAKDSSPAIIGALGFKSGRDTDKFQNVETKVEGKLPVIADSCGYIVCDVIDTMETPTHTVFLGKLVASGTFGDREQMTYDYYHKVVKGTSPKNAPTFDPNASAQPPASKGTKKYRCTICGYEYEGDELPDDFTCPLCGVGKELFEEVK